MTCKLCNQPGEYRDRFNAVLCLTHHLEALLGFLNDQPKVKYATVVPVYGNDGPRGEREEHGQDRVRASPQCG